MSPIIPVLFAFGSLALFMVGKRLHWGTSTLLTLRIGVVAVALIVFVIASGGLAGAINETVTFAQSVVDWVRGLADHFGEPASDAAGEAQEQVVNAVKKATK